MTSGDTIAAISSAVGAAARMIVRVSGSLAPQLHQCLTHETNFDSSSARRCELHFSGMAVPSWAYCFASPRSVTGEDVLELHIPGNPLLARLLLAELIRLGARQAEPGEFTARAYFNGRLDLTEAEGVAATIAAQSERELAAARQLMAGELSRRLRPILDEIAELLGLVEVGIDFSEEDVTFLSAAQIQERIACAEAAMEHLLADSVRFERLAHEPRVVLVGRPNAGKSTLLNALAGRERAVVSENAGTTRDVLWAHAQLLRGMIRVVDVAGLEDDTSPDDAIAREMQARARRTIEEAEIVVAVRDVTDERPAPALARPVDLRIATKCDQAGMPRADELAISAITGMNLSPLREKLDVLAFGQESAGAALALNARHVRAIESTREALSRAVSRLADAGPEVLALELRETLDNLGSILGSVTPDDVLGRIFSRFCIGK